MRKHVLAGLAMLGLAAIAPALADGFFIRRGASGVKPSNVAPEWQTDAGDLAGSPFLTGQAFSASVAATDSQTVSYSSLDLPGGLILASGTGAITGTTPAPGHYSFTVSASDGSAQTGRVFSFDSVTAEASAGICAGGAVHDTRGCRWTTSGTFSFTVPAGVTSLHAKLWGAGAGRTLPNTTAGGAGGYVGGDVAVTPGETIGFEISAVQTTSYSPPDYGGKGGPRAAIWRGGNTSELLVAGGGGGGGGGGGSAFTCIGGGGGGGASFSVGAGTGHNGGAGTNPCVNGTYSSSAPAGLGGTGGAGGAGGGLGSPRTHPTVPYYVGASGARILGGVYGGSGFQGSNGGDGYYGGGAGGPADYNIAAGGGGSSFAAATGVSNVTFAGGSGATPGNSGDADRGTAGAPNTSSVEPGAARIVIRWD